MSRQVDIKISGRKINGYPTVHYTVIFDTVGELIVKADGLIEDTKFGKVDCYIDNFDNILNEEEVELLECEHFIIE